MSTYSNLSVELIGTGEQDGTWGNTTNANLGTALEEAIVGTVSQAVGTGDTTLTWSVSSNATQVARHLRLNLTGSAGGSGNLIIPTTAAGGANTFTKSYIINNASNTAITVKTASGSGVLVPAGKSSSVYADGTNVVYAVDYHSGSVISGDVTITGGTINGTQIGNATPSTGAFTTLAASSTVSGTGFTARFATPGPIGNTSASTGNFTTLGATGNVTLGDAVGDEVTHNAGTVNVPNNLIYSGTGAVTQTVGTTAQRPGSAAAGMFRYNSTTGEFEGYTTGWGSIGGGASAGGAIYENVDDITANYTITAGSNGMSVGPMTIAGGVTVTVPSGQRWVIL
tara:strand:+ start:1185 stop:2204 length:1020 start_codon:yes stop_codon:yes gene_type:complete